jgi:hypothetical protein
VEVVVCDRPNPLGGLALEGGPVEQGCRSFVSELPVPVRHGMTLGELALLLREERHAGLALSVLSCSGWKREAWWDQTGLPWVPLSPNMPTPATATIYLGACLVEATNLSEGRGTTRPFHVVGAPWLDGERLAAGLALLDLPGSHFRPTVFRPEFGKHAGKVTGVSGTSPNAERHDPWRRAYLLAEIRRCTPASSRGGGSPTVRLGRRPSTYSQVQPCPRGDRGGRRSLVRSVASYCEAKPSLSGRLMRSRHEGAPGRT